MPSTIISALASAMFIAATVANPVNPTPQIDAGCDGSILNLYSFASEQCNNTDPSVTPFFYNQKLAANPGRTTACTKIRIPSNLVNSFVYTSDGIDNGTCTLRLYTSQNCRDRDPVTYRVDQDISGCNSETFRAVKLASCERPENLGSSSYALLGADNDVSGISSVSAIHFNGLR
ncbi:hypothetical protein Q7P35_009410 [Cladosporium inversicolor]